MKVLLSVFLVIVAFNSCASNYPRLETAQSVEIERYVGKWYALSAFPQFFTRKCVAQTADYGIINPQTISVLNTCLKKNGKQTINGQAVVTNAATNAELEVSFNTFFTRLFRARGDYNILKLDSDYRYVMIGGMNRKSLWIMSRTTSMPADVYAAYVAEAKRQGFDVSKLELSKF